MRYHPIFHLAAVLTVFALSFFSYASTVEAEGFATVGTTLTMEPPVAVTVGYPAKVILHLISSKGTPVSAQSVELFVNGKSERRIRTDAFGTAVITVRRDEVGTFTLYASFKGSKLPSLGSSKASGELTIKPAIVEIHTTPSLPNVKFELGGQVFSSDEHGVARLEVQKAGTYHLQILPLKNDSPDIQMDFSRWGDDYFQPARDIQVPLDKPLQVGFEVSYKVNQTFVDLSDQPVDLSRITSVTLKGSNGTTYTFEDHQWHWLPAGRVIRLNNGLQETKILYSIISVIIDGSNVVSQAQQRYYVHSKDVWTVKLLLYSARFTARDALFGFPVGSGIHVEYPDGGVQSFSFDSNKQHKSEGMARGIYRVTVTGARGYAPPTPIALSRNQDVELLVFSYLDMGVFATIGLFLSLGLLLFGRPYIVSQTAALGANLWLRIRASQPSILPQLLNKLTALRFFLFRKRGMAEPEASKDVAMTDYVASTEIEAMNTVTLDKAQDDASSSQGDEFPGIALDHSNDGTTDLVLEISPSALETEVAPSAPSTDQSVEDLIQSEDDGVAPVAPMNQDNHTEPDTVTLNCKVCGSTQLVKKAKRSGQQRYQCEACGAFSNFGTRRSKRSRQRMKVETPV